MVDLREVELRIAVAEGVLSREEADALGEEARQKKQSPLALLVERGRLSEDSFQSLFAEALNDPAWRAAGQETSASTYGGSLPPLPVSPAAAGEAAFPVANWDRYVNVRFLGQGGMGKVFLAIDKRLRREVAIKFVRGDDLDHTLRLVAEARAQAKVHHERICGVYDVGEVEGKVYIAMQYIAGKPLGSLAGELTLEQKVMVVRGAAEGLHEAHRAGIIHRDVKPSNIMVERTADGEIRPYVMDFGLAHSTQEAGTTLTGTVLGTPRYMAPEQAQGDTAKLDRRADVYSLGATLYHVLTGQPPIPGGTVTEVIQKLLSMEPRRLREIDPNIPVDLEAIVLKCLEKDRSSRYDSARALADDLARFLNGEPVRARPADVWYRLRKRVAKHRRLVAAGAAALLLLGIAVGWGVKARGEAAERGRLARRFTEMVERIEAKARYSALSRIHDIRGDRAAIRTQMHELEVEIRRGGEVGAGPGHYALGRGYLALDDDASAREELDRAWQGGYREPRVAYALALVMGHLYRQALLAAERIDNRELREAKKRQIEKQYRDPALSYLRESEGAEVPSTEYVAALVAYYEGRLDDALKHLDAIGGGLPWFYEAPELRGDILLARALVLGNGGEGERAQREFEAGRKAYAAAAATGESVPAVYTALGELEYAAMVLELYGHGDVAPPSQHALAATVNALAAVPDHYDALVLQARIQRSLAEHLHNQGEQVEGLLATALAAAERAAAVSPARPQARLELAQVHRQLGSVWKGRNQDPGEQLRLAVAISDGISPEDRDAAYYRNLGLAFMTWADYQDDNAIDSQENRRKAIAAYTRALEIDDKDDKIWIDVGINGYKRALRPDDPDPDGDLQQALGALDRARSLNPQRFATYFYLGEIHDQMAEREAARDRDPEPELARAIDAYAQGLQINSKSPQLHNGIGIAVMNEAQAAWDRGRDPEPLLARARKALDDARAVARDQTYACGNIVALLGRRAWFQNARGEDPSATVGEAVAVFNVAAAQLRAIPPFRASLAKVYAIRATYELEHGRDPEQSLELAEAALGSATAKAQDDTESQLYLGVTRGLRARILARQGRARAKHFEDAEPAFLRAIKLYPENRAAQIALGQLYRAWAVFLRDTGSALDRPLTSGLQLIDRVLERHSVWPDALVLRANLLLLQAQSSADAADLRALAEKAVQAFTTALEINRALTKVWGAQKAQAEVLAGTPR